MSRTSLPAPTDLDPPLQMLLASLMDEGAELWDRFDAEVRAHRWHPFVAADYDRVLQALLPMRAPGVRFLELGSATGIITIMADLLGFEAYGIELDAALVDTARDLATKYESAAHFAAGSFLPAGYVWRSSDGDARRGTIGHGASAYRALGHPLDDFDLVYGYPWTGEEPMMLDLMRAYGRPGARLIVHGGADGVRIHTNGPPQS